MWKICCILSPNVTSASALTNAQGAPHTEQALGITGRAGAASPLDRESICLIEIERRAISTVTRRVRLIIDISRKDEKRLHKKVGSISETTLRKSHFLARHVFGGFKGCSRKAQFGIKSPKRFRIDALLSAR
jgi:hypothetical protein